MAKTMQFGVMQRGVFGLEDDMGVRFGELMEQARVLDKLGYDSITTGSHFSTHPHREFMQVPYFCRVMAEAPNMRLNAGIVLLSLHNPLEVAENFAVLDVMSGGKVIFGCALGYRDVEYKGFGVKKGEGGSFYEDQRTTSAVICRSTPRAACSRRPGCPAPTSPTAATRRVRPASARSLRNRSPCVRFRCIIVPPRPRGR